MAIPSLRSCRARYFISDGKTGNYWSSSQYNANNAWNLNNGSLNNNNKTNSNGTVAFFEIEMSAITLDETWAAYFDCRKRKRASIACAEFEIKELEEVPRLYRELRDGTYEIGYSNAFVVTRPKYREVFAADFRDRIVHHYLMLKTMDLFEQKFIEDSYNCRKGKGVNYAIKRIQKKILTMGDCWILKCDLQSFFMSIDKPLLARSLDQFLLENYKGNDLEFIRKITQQVVLHRPETKCRKRGDLELWNELPANKSLFTSDGDKGMAIGNLTSQIYANFYMSFFDEWLLTHEGIEYGRYVDDFVLIAKDKKQLLKLLPEMREWLQKNLLLKLHPKKVYLQHASKGLTFVGYAIKGERIYAGRRLVGNLYNLIKEYNSKADRGIWIENNIERFVQRYNSFMGFMVHTRSYNIRVKAWSMIDERIKELIYITKHYSVIKVRNKYKLKNKKYAEIKSTNSGLYRGKKGTSRSLLCQCTAGR